MNSGRTQPVFYFFGPQAGQLTERDEGFSLDPVMITGFKLSSNPETNKRGDEDAGAEFDFKPCSQCSALVATWLGGGWADQGLAAGKSPATLDGRSGIGQYPAGSYYRHAFAPVFLWFYSDGTGPASWRSRSRPHHLFFDCHPRRGRGLTVADQRAPGPSDDPGTSGGCPGYRHNHRLAGRSHLRTCRWRSNRSSQ